MIPSTDWQGETSIPPFNFTKARGIINTYLKMDQNGHHFAENIFNAFSWMKIVVYQFTTFHWILFVRVHWKTDKPVTMCKFQIHSNRYMKHFLWNCPHVNEWQTPVPLRLFQSNSKLDQNLQCSGLKFTPPITTKFCTSHDSVIVVTCAKFCCDWLRLF